MPQPREKETKSEYIDRCMSDDNEQKKHSDRDERYAACLGYWKNEH